MSRDLFHQTRLLRAPSNLALNPARDGAATASLGNLGQGLTTLMGKNFFLISHLNLPFFSSELFPLVLSLHPLVKSPSPPFLLAPPGTGSCSKVTPEPSLLQAEQPPLSSDAAVYFVCCTRCFCETGVDESKGLKNVLVEDGSTRLLRGEHRLTPLSNKPHQRATTQICESLIFSCGEGDGVFQQDFSPRSLFSSFIPAPWTVIAGVPPPAPVPEALCS